MTSSANDTINQDILYKQSTVTSYTFGMKRDLKRLTTINFSLHHPSAGTKQTVRAQKVFQSSKSYGNTKSIHHISTYSKHHNSVQSNSNPSCPIQPRLISTTSHKMADDTSYSTFLSRANQDLRSGHEAEGESTSQARGKFDPSSSTSSNEAIPASLRGINATFVSDTDSDFEPVFFSYASDSLPSTREFKKVLGVKGENAREIEEVSEQKFDPRGEYRDVVAKVKEAGKEARGKRGQGGEDGAKVFRVQLDTTRAEYYVIAVGERSLVGVVAKAVES